MARDGGEWSCPLCTLLNNWRDRRCAACDNARPASAKKPEKAPAAASVASGVQPVSSTPTLSFVYRDVPGAFFSSAAPSNGRPAASSWRQEKRLTVNRRSFKRSAATSTGTTNVPDRRQLDRPILPEAASTPAATAAETVENEADDDVEIPCFNLLGPGMAIFSDADAAPPASAANEEIGSRAPSGGDDIVDIPSSPDSPRTTRISDGAGFVPARDALQERAIDAKLASAGLDLSDSNEDSDSGSHRLRRKKRSLSPVNRGTSDQWECEVCTNFNSSALTKCDLCDHERATERNNRSDRSHAPPVASAPQWECPVCTNFNSAATSKCELCDTIKAQDNECSVCSKILAPNSDRCDRCGTLRDQDSSAYIDLAASPDDKYDDTANRRKPDYDSDFENPYEMVNDDDDYPPAAGTGAAYDSIEEISDNEPIPSFNRPQQIRSDLKEFEHFVSVEDLRSDYGCKVDYRSMFTGGRTGKSYGDRLATRKKQSQKRKREAAQREQQGGNGLSKGGRQSKSAAGKKAATRKSNPIRRRASTGAKRAKKGGTKPRRSSTATSASSVNYYDSNSVDFGEDVRTMAWEGVGSASYY